MGPGHSSRRAHRSQGRSRPVPTSTYGRFPPLDHRGCESQVRRHRPPRKSVGKRGVEVHRVTRIARDVSMSIEVLGKVFNHLVRTIEPIGVHPPHRPGAALLVVEVIREVPTNSKSNRLLFPRASSIHWLATAPLVVSTGSCASDSRFLEPLEYRQLFRN